jgi:hypothetical protein
MRLPAHRVPATVSIFASSLTDGFAVARKQSPQVYATLWPKRHHSGFGIGYRRRCPTASVVSGFRVPYRNPALWCVTQSGLPEPQSLDSSRASDSE